MLEHYRTIRKGIQEAKKSSGTLPKLVALHPKLLPTIVSSEQLWGVGMHLMIAAALAERVPVWP